MDAPKNPPIDPSFPISNPSPTAPAFPVRKVGEEGSDYLARLSRAYRHGEVWAITWSEFAPLMLAELNSGESLRPDVREEAVDVLFRMFKAEVPRGGPGSVIDRTPGKYVVTQEVREKIWEVLPFRASVALTAVPSPK